MLCITCEASGLYLRMLFLHLQFKAKVLCAKNGIAKYHIRYCRFREVQSTGLEFIHFRYKFKLKPQNQVVSNSVVVHSSNRHSFHPGFTKLKYYIDLKVQ